MNQAEQIQKAVPTGRYGQIGNQGQNKSMGERLHESSKWFMGIGFTMFALGTGTAGVGAGFKFVVNGTDIIVPPSNLDLSVVLMIGGAVVAGTGAVGCGIGGAISRCFPKSTVVVPQNEQPVTVVDDSPTSESVTVVSGVETTPLLEPTKIKKLRGSPDTGEISQPFEGSEIPLDDRTKSQTEKVDLGNDPNDTTSLETDLSYNVDNPDHCLPQGGGQKKLFDDS